MGGALGALWAKAGHEVVFSFSKDDGKLAELAAVAGSGARAGSVSEAVQTGDVVMLAVWVDALDEVLANGELFKGKTVISCVSGLTPDFTGQTIGINTDLETSIAEQIQTRLPDAKVVEAFNTTFAEVLAAESRDFGGANASIFYCGDDEKAKQTAAALIEECGYEAVDAGALTVARSLETLATAWVQFAVASRLFPQLGLKALRR